MVLLLVFMQLTRDLFAIAKFLLLYTVDETRPKRIPGCNIKILSQWVYIRQSYKNNSNIILLGK